MNAYRWVVLALIAAVGIYWIIDRERLVAQQVELPSIQYDATRVDLPPAPAPSSQNLSPTEQAEVRNDPLYKAILNEFHQGRESLIPGEGKNRQNDTRLGTKSLEQLNSSEWLAIELMLRAARILESQEARQASSQTDQPSRSYQATVQALRSEAAKLIRD